MKNKISSEHSNKTNIKIAPVSYVTFDLCAELLKSKTQMNTYSDFNLITQLLKNFFKNSTKIHSTFKSNLNFHPSIYPLHINA